MEKTSKIKIEKEAVVTSPTKEKFIALIEAYKKQNPVKFALKKESFEAKIASLK